MKFKFPGSCGGKQKHASDNHAFKPFIMVKDNIYVL